MSLLIRLGELERKVKALELRETVLTQLLEQMVERFQRIDESTVTAVCPSCGDPDQHRPGCARMGEVGPWTDGQPAAKAARRKRA